MQLVVTIAMIIYISVLVFLAVYLLTHLSKNFLIFKPETAHNVRQAMLITSILLIVVSLAGIIILIVAKPATNLITLVAGSLVVAGFALVLTLGPNS